MNWSNCKVVECSPEKMSGDWVFKGSRIPVSTLFLNLRDGATVADFVEWFPGVSEEQVTQVLEFVGSESLVAAA